MSRRSPAGLRRHYLRQNERRKLKTWSRALATLVDPVSLILETDDPGRVPIAFLSLHELKGRIQELNVAMVLAGFEGGQGRQGTKALRPAVTPLDPVVLRQDHLFALDAFERAHQSGRAVYAYMIRRGNIVPAAGEEWSFFTHADLTTALPEMKLQWGRRRARYLVQVVRDGARIGAIRVYSVNYTPIIERRFK